MGGVTEYGNIVWPLKSLKLAIQIHGTSIDGLQVFFKKRMSGGLTILLQ